MKKLALVLLAVLAKFTPHVCADTTAFTTGGGNYVHFGGSTTAGYTFTLANSVSVTRLGLWDYAADGLQSAVPVTIWNGSGAVLATATVPTGTTAGEINQYLYVTLATPVTLPAGTYTIGGYITNYSDAALYGLSTITGATGITYGASREAGGTAMPVGDNINLSNSYFGPNFQFTNAVPEPSAWAVVAAGTGLLGLTLRRRLRAC